MFETDKQQLDVINRRRTNERQLVFNVSNPSRQISPPTTRLFTILLCDVDEENHGI